MSNTVYLRMYRMLPLLPSFLLILLNKKNREYREYIGESRNTDTQAIQPHQN